MEKNLKRVTREQAEKLNKLGFDYETDFAYCKDEAHVGLLTVEAIMRTSKPFYFAPTVDLALQYLEEKWGFYYEIYKGEGSDVRFGLNYIIKLLGLDNRKIEILNPQTNDEDDLMQDFVSIITSFVARLYGRRRSKRNTEKLIKELNK